MVHSLDPTATSPDEVSFRTRHKMYVVELWVCPKCSVIELSIGLESSSRAAATFHVADLDLGARPREGANIPTSTNVIIHLYASRCRVLFFAPSGISLGKAPCRDELMHVFVKAGQEQFEDPCPLHG